MLRCQLLFSLELATLLLMSRCHNTRCSLRACAPSLLISLLAVPSALALPIGDIPADAPQDAIMAGPTELQEMQDWASAAFTGQRASGRDPAVRVELRRQDYSSLRFGQSCMETPIKIKLRKFKHGLGTHANSEIVLHLPPDAREFKAFAGIDNNFDTGGVRGSAQFSVEVAGKQVFHTRTLRGTNGPVPVRVALPDGWSTAQGSRTARIGSKTGEGGIPLGSEGGRGCLWRTCHRAHSSFGRTRQSPQAARIWECHRSAIRAKTEIGSCG